MKSFNCKSFPFETLQLWNRYQLHTGIKNNFIVVILLKPCEQNWENHLFPLAFEHGSCWNHFSTWKLTEQRVDSTLRVSRTYRKLCFDDKNVFITTRLKLTWRTFTTQLRLESFLWSNLANGCVHYGKSHGKHHAVYLPNFGNFCCSAG